MRLSNTTKTERIRSQCQIKNEQVKAEAIDLLLDELQRRTRRGAAVSFNHNLVLKIEKLIVGHTQRAKIVALVRTEIH